MDSPDSSARQSWLGSAEYDTSTGRLFAAYLFAAVLFAYQIQLVYKTFVCISVYA
jgi:hypothetical protein